MYLLVSFCLTIDLLFILLRLNGDIIISALLQLIDAIDLNIVERSMACFVSFFEDEDNLTFVRQGAFLCYILENQYSIFTPEVVMKSSLRILVLLFFLLTIGSSHSLLCLYSYYFFLTKNSSADNDYNAQLASYCPSPVYVRPALRVLKESGTFGLRKRMASFLEHVVEDLSDVSGKL